tara:strand:+ start:1757 stop:1996 length:240 start_codon:yes stop_codon:yes gene_type:complete
LSKKEQISQAKSLLENDFFKEEIKKIRQLYLEQIANTSHEQIEEREDLYRMVRAVEKVISHFESLAMDIKIEEKKWRIF